nr:histone deacetylase 14 [Tanacetum cinerariifolium]
MSRLACRLERATSYGSSKDAEESNFSSLSGHPAEHQLFSAFTASSDVPSIYIHQFWNTLTMDTKSGIYSFQLDKLWFTLDADLLCSALGITLKDSAYSFVAPPAGGRHNIHKRPQSPLHITTNDYSLDNLKFVPKGELDEVFGMAIPKELINDVIRILEYYQKYLDMAARKPRQATNVTDEQGGKKKASLV